MISEETLGCAVKEYAQAFFASLPDTQGFDHTFSPKFEKKMQHLCHKVKYESTYSFLKRMACAIIAIILCGSMLLMLNTEVRAAVVGWITGTYNGFTRYFFNNEDDEEIVFRTYGFKNLPKDYVFLDSTQTDSGASTLYLGPDGNFLDLSYQFGQEDDAFFFKTEDHTHTQENIDGQIMDIYISENPQYTNTIIWVVDEQILFKISAKCDKATLIELAKNVQPIE